MSVGSSRPDTSSATALIVCPFACQSAVFRQCCDRPGALASHWWISRLRSSAEPASVSCAVFMPWQHEVRGNLFGYQRKPHLGAWSCEGSVPFVDVECAISPLRVHTTGRVTRWASLVSYKTCVTSCNTIWSCLDSAWLLLCTTMLTAPGVATNIAAPLCLGRQEVLVRTQAWHDSAMMLNYVFF
jgi:hypothetical protein